MTRAGSVVLEGVTLAYRETGVPDDLPVVLLHATGERASTWDRFAAALAGAGRYAIALDLRGHGDSSRPAKYSLELMADDVRLFLDASGFSQIDLVGHSLGGAVALRVAAREALRIRLLVIEDAPGPPRDNESGDGRPLPPEDPPEPVDFDWALVRPMFVDLRTPDPALWARIPSIPARTLLISGGPASHVDPSRIDALAAALPDAQVVPIDAGHLIHEAAPDEFAEAVLPFLSRGPRS